MKITKTYLRQVIKEELNRLTEAVEPEEYGDYVGQESSAKKQFTAPIYIIGKSSFFVKSENLPKSMRVPAGKDLAFYINTDHFNKKRSIQPNIGKFTKMSANALQTAEIFDRDAVFTIGHRGIEWDGIERAGSSLEL